MQRYFLSDITLLRPTLATAITLLAVLVLTMPMPSAAASSSAIERILDKGVLTVAMFGEDVPVEVAIILLVAIDPIVDPVLTVVNVQANAATTILLASADDHGSRVQSDQEIVRRP